MAKQIHTKINRNKKLRIKDIAELAGVSEGTVDRVLHNRGHVAEDKLERIEEIIQKQNYQPNIFARSLAVKKDLRFVSLIPNFKPGEYWGLIKQGIDKAEKELGNYRITVDHHAFDQYNGDSFVAEIEKIEKSRPDAVIFSPVFINESIRFAKKLQSLSIPFVLIDSNVEEMDCLAYYGQHALKSGYTVAKLLFDGLPEKTTILIARSARLHSKGSNQAINREKGFMKYVNEKELNRKYTIVRVDLHSNGLQKNLTQIKKIANSNPPLSGAVIFSSKVHRLVRYFRALNLVNLKIIGYDELTKNVADLKKGNVSYLIGQRPEMQGYLGVKDLCKQLILKQSTHRTNYVPIDILTKEIVDEYTQFNQRLNE